jgi:CheY-like chemotaxis protein
VVKDTPEPEINDEKGSWMIVATNHTRERRPRLVLALADSVQAMQSSHLLDQLGWAVHRAATGPAARQLAYELGAEVVVLDTAHCEESGWLTCAKLTLTRGAPRVVLVDGQMTRGKQQLAELVGAASVVCGAPGLVEAVMSE